MSDPFKRAFDLITDAGEEGITWQELVQRANISNPYAINSLKIMLDDLLARKVVSLRAGKYFPNYHVEGYKNNP